MEITWGCEFYSCIDLTSTLTLKTSEYILWTWLIQEVFFYNCLSLIERRVGIFLILNPLFRLHPVTLKTETIEIYVVGSHYNSRNDLNNPVFHKSLWCIDISKQASCFVKTHIWNNVSFKSTSSTYEMWYKLMFTQPIELIFCMKSDGFYSSSIVSCIWICFYIYNTSGIYM